MEGSWQVAGDLASRNLPDLGCKVVVEGHPFEQEHTVVRGQRISKACFGEELLTGP